MCAVKKSFSKNINGRALKGRARNPSVLGDG